MIAGPPTPPLSHKPVHSSHRRAKTLQSRLRAAAGLAAMGGNRGSAAQAARARHGRSPALLSASSDGRAPQAGGSGPQPACLSRRSREQALCSGDAFPFGLSPFLPPGAVALSAAVPRVLLYTRMCEPHWTPGTTSRAGPTVPTLSRHTEAERRPCPSHAGTDEHESPRPLGPAASSRSPSRAGDHRGVPETQRLTYAKKQPHGYGLRTGCVLRTRHVVNSPQQPAPALMDTSRGSATCHPSEERCCRQARGGSSFSCAGHLPPAAA